MNKEQTIKKILKLGFKEFKPCPVVFKCANRAWNKDFTEDIFVNILYWNKNNKWIDKPIWKIKIYSQTNFVWITDISNIYNFNDVFDKMLKFIKFLKVLN